MYIRLSSGLAFLMLAAFVPARLAHARVGEAEVREGPRGGPCFTISPHEERLGTPEFQSVTVSDGPRLLWRMALPKERGFPLSFAMCVPYGGKLAALPRTQSTPLEPGRVYSLRIDARPGKGRAASSYEARFCLARQHDGSAVVHQIWSGDREGRRLYGCLPPGD
jgi:hypothetical protein